MTCRCPLSVLPSGAERSGLWLHGTSEDAVQDIAKGGLLEPAPLEYHKERYQYNPLVEPIAGRVYLTRDPVYALAFAILRRGRKDQNAVYIVEVDGEDFVDVEPDEDTVGTLILRASYPQLNALALTKLPPDLFLRYAHLLQQAPAREAFRDLWKGIAASLCASEARQSGRLLPKDPKERRLTSVAPLGKWLLSRLDPEERRLFLDAVEIQVIAHVGALPVTGGLRIVLPFDKSQDAALEGLSCHGSWRRFREWAQPILKTAERVF